ncbi:MAG: tRNA (adenosine(37)-N6)-threonylcarbamoyltransferase complex ATPase subunit type 1 TsaE [Pseudomonadota bacterium]
MSRIEHNPAIVESPAPEAQPLACTTLLLADESATAALAARLAACAQIGQAHLHCYGDLGSGKTTFVRHLLRALGVQGRIKSPSYAIVETYRLEAGPRWGPGMEVVHADFYRLINPQEWEDAGLRELFTQPGLKLVEWPQKATGMLPMPDLELHLETLADDSRRLQLGARTALGVRLLEALQA